MDGGAPLFLDYSTLCVFTETHLLTHAVCIPAGAPVGGEVTDGDEVGAGDATTAEVGSAEVDVGETVGVAAEIANTNPITRRAIETL